MADQRIIYNEEMVGASHPTKGDTLNRITLIEHDPDGTHQKAISHLTANLPVFADQNKKLLSRDIAAVVNLKPVVNAAANKLDIFTKSGGAAPDASNVITVAIPDGNGFTMRSRAAAYLSGISQIVMADAANYWSKGSLDAEIKTCWLYAIWDGTGIVWALGGYSGFTMVPTTTTATDDDYFLFEDGSTYTRSNNHYCVAVAKIRYQYDTADTPDHTIQVTVENAPQVIWNAKIDYGYSKSASNVTSAGDISAQALTTIVVKQSGKYKAIGKCGFVAAGATTTHSGNLFIRTGSATYGSAILKDSNHASLPTNTDQHSSTSVIFSGYLNAGDSIHLGGALSAGGGTRTISNIAIKFYRED